MKLSANKFFVERTQQDLDTDCRSVQFNATIT
jgi:hypothetical protein